MQMLDRTIPGWGFFPPYKAMEKKYFQWKMRLLCVQNFQYVHYFMHERVNRWGADWDHFEVSLCVQTEGLYIEHML